MKNNGDGSISLSLYIYILTLYILQLKQIYLRWGKEKKQPFLIIRFSTWIYMVIVEWYIPLGGEKKHGFLRYYDYIQGGCGGIIMDKGTAIIVCKAIELLQSFIQ